MKSIALCYAGLPVYGNFCLDAFMEKAGLEASKIDMYACFWDARMGQEEIKYLSQNFDQSFISYIKKEAPIAELPARFFVFPETNVFRVLAMFYIRKKLFDFLVNNNKKYDAYIFVRFDLTIEKELDLRWLFDNFSDSGSLFLPYAGNYRNGYTDTLAVADWLGFKCYLTVYERLLDILESNKEYVFPKNARDFVMEVRAGLKMLNAGKHIKSFRSTPLHPETIVRRNIELYGLKPGFFDVGDILIKRDASVSRLTVQKETPSLSLAKNLTQIFRDELGEVADNLFKRKSS